MQVILTLNETTAVRMSLSGNRFHIVFGKEDSTDYANSANVALMLPVESAPDLLDYLAGMARAALKTAKNVPGVMPYLSYTQCEQAYFDACHERDQADVLVPTTDEPRYWGEGDWSDGQ